jgi:hypothetical protein
MEQITQQRSPDAQLDVDVIVAGLVEGGRGTINSDGRLYS